MSRKNCTGIVRKLESIFVRTFPPLRKSKAFKKNVLFINRTLMIHFTSSSQFCLDFSDPVISIVSTV